MKQLLIIAITLFLGHSVMSAQATYQYDRVCLIDITEIWRPVVSLKTIQHTVPQDVFLWGGVRIEIEVISEFHYEVGKSFFLPAQHPLHDSQYARKRQVMEFWKDIEEFLDDIAAMKAGRNNSSVWTTIARKLAELGDRNSEDKQMIVYSDFAQKVQGGINIYDHHTLEKARANPEKYVDQLNGLAAIRSLETTKVFLIYQAQNERDNAVFIVTSRIFRLWITSLGGQAFVSAQYH